MRPGFATLDRYRRERVEYYSSSGLLVDKGEEWWNIRSKAQQPLMKTKNMNNYVPLLGSISDELIDR